MGNLLISVIFEANLSFSALLLAVQGILISLYLRAEHDEWKRRFKILLTVSGGTFLIGIVDCILSLFYMLLSSASRFAFYFIVSLFISELVILGSAGLWLVMMLVRDDV